MLKIKKIAEVIGKKVYTDTGDFFGQLEEANLIDNKIDGWRIRVAGQMGMILGGARGVIIPHHFVKAVGDVIVISRASLPLGESGDVSEEADLTAASNEGTAFI
jgi:sporulation protein YlmC with PRC-barrel domain